MTTFFPATSIPTWISTPGSSFGPPGIPYDMFTVLFAIGRTPGWLAHWREMYHGEDFRIMRPRQIYVGATSRRYVEREHRG